MPVNVFFNIERSRRWGADDVGVVCVLCMPTSPCPAGVISGEFVACLSECYKEGRFELRYSGLRLDERKEVGVLNL